MKKINFATASFKDFERIEGLDMMALSEYF